MPTSSGVTSNRYSTRTSSITATARPRGSTKKININTLPYDRTHPNHPTSSQYYGSGNVGISSLSSSRSARGSSYASSKDMDSLSNKYAHLDTNNNYKVYEPAPSLQGTRGTYDSYHTSSSDYGSSYRDKEFHSPTTSHIKKSVSSRSSSVESTNSSLLHPSTPNKGSLTSVGARNYNDSCGSHPSSSSEVDLHQTGRSSSGNIGLTNLGNTCFMNSVLQCLLNTRVLVEYMLSPQMEKDINKTTSSMKGSLMEAYAQLVTKVWDDPRRAAHTISPKDLKAKIQKFAPRFTGYNQHDSQELLRYLLEGLHEDVNRVRSKPKYIECDEERESKMTDEEKAAEYWTRYLNFDNSAIVDIFVGQLKSTLRCETCHYESVTFDPFWDLSLPIPKMRHEVSIQDCMEMFMREETLDGDERPTCYKCKARRKCTKTFKIQRFPKIMVLHLKRFSGERFRQKLSTKVNFDVHGLNLMKFGTSSKQNATYNLYGISNHVGSVYSGHYTAYCKHPYQQRRWYSFNDSSVGTISESTLVSDEAYLLFYELQSS